jgi:two pore calcium channel protein 1
MIEGPSTQVYLCCARALLCLYFHILCSVHLSCRFDFLLVVISIFGHVTEASIASAFIFLRPLRLLRLLRLKRRYRDMMNTLIVLLPQLLNIVLVLLVLYYFYAIWAMEFFSGTVSPNCCERSVFL